jgi:hypothetical protein
LPQSGSDSDSDSFDELSDLVVLPREDGVDATMSIPAMAMRFPSLEQFVAEQESDRLCQLLRAHAVHPASDRRPAQELPENASEDERHQDALLEAAARRWGMAGAQQRLFAVNARSQLLTRVSAGGSEIVVPKSLRERMLRELHDGAGHFGAERTMAAMKGSLWWPALRRDIEAMCSSCRICCQVRAVPLANRRAVEWRKIRYVSAPRLSWHIDFIGPFPTTRGQRYVLCCIDEFSNWIELFPVAEQTGEEIQRCVQALASEHGWPLYLRFDNGPGFNSTALKAWMDVRRIAWLEIPANAPQANGVIESHNRTIKGVIRRMLADCVERRASWLDFIGVAKLALNTAVSKAFENRLSPFEVMNGTKPLSRVHRALGGEREGLASHSESATEAALAAFRSELERQATLRQAVAIALEKRRRESQALRAGDHDEELRERHRRMHSFEPGDMVWVTRSGSVPSEVDFVSRGARGNPGQARAFEGEVIEKHGPLVYRVRFWREPNGRKFVAKCRREQLKPRDVMRLNSDVGLRGVR